MTNAVQELLVAGCRTEDGANLFAEPSGTYTAVADIGGQLVGFVHAVVDEDAPGAPSLTTSTSGMTCSASASVLVC